MIAKVGDDQFGGRLCQGLVAAGANASAVTAAKGTASGVALISVDAWAQNSIISYSWRQWQIAATGLGEEPAVLAVSRNYFCLTGNSVGNRRIFLLHGAYIADADGQRKMLPAFKVKAVDTTAAGDAFNGGLAVALMRGDGLEVAAHFASAVASLSVTRVGAQPAMPMARQVSTFLKGSSECGEWNSNQKW
jgi:sugar/nucleoside kinase (ribokinase family)